MAGAFPPNTIASLTAPPRQRGGGEDRVDQEAQYGQLTYSGHKAERGKFTDTTKATATNSIVEHHPRGTPITGSLPPQSPLHYEGRETTATGLLISSPRAPREAVRPLDSLSSADVAALLSARGIAAVVVAKLLAVPLCGADLALATHADLARDVGLGAPTIKKLLALCARTRARACRSRTLSRRRGRRRRRRSRCPSRRGRSRRPAASRKELSQARRERHRLLRLRRRRPPSARARKGTTTPVDAAAAVARVKTIAGKAGDASVASAAARRKEARAARRGRRAARRRRRRRRWPWRAAARRRSRRRR